MISFQDMRERAKQEAWTGKAEEMEEKHVYNVIVYKRSESVYEFGSQGIEGENQL